MALRAVLDESEGPLMDPIEVSIPTAREGWRCGSGMREADVNSGPLIMSPR
jgi:hypothetical protein